jgi:putative transposase
MITRRPRRLAGIDYVGLQRYFVTTCTAFRRPVFQDSILAANVATQFLQSARQVEFATIAYCFMPDHVHLLLNAESDHADLERLRKHAKQVSGFSYRRTHQDTLWQPGYHERVLRNDEETLTVARYVLENPVRAGLAKQLGEWPNAGSDVYGWKELFAAWERQT